MYLLSTTTAHISHRRNLLKNSGESGPKSEFRVRVVTYKLCKHRGVEGVKNYEPLGRLKGIFSVKYIYIFLGWKAKKYRDNCGPR